MYKTIIFIFSVVLLTSCSTNNTTSTSHVIHDMDVYLKKARSKTEPIKSLRNVYKELSIIKLNRPSLTAIHYDSCLTVDLINRIDAYENNKLKINVLDLRYLNNFIEGEKVEDEQADWPFLHSRDFDHFVPLDEISEIDDEKAVEALAHWYKLKDIRFTVVLYEQSKILPRTKYDNYVLGGYFQGYGILYDLVEHKILCYFNVRINNLSNEIEDYTKDGIEIYDVMIDELKRETKSKIQFELSRKLNIDEALIDKQTLPKFFLYATQLILNR